jgi:hypothetical protein
MKPPVSILASAAVSGAVMIASTQAFAAAACAPHDEFARHLATNYNEESQGVGVTNDGSLFEIFASEGGTWSLLITNGRKISCIVAAGDMWVDKPALGPEARLER